MALQDIVNKQPQEPAVDMTTSGGYEEPEISHPGFPGVRDFGTTKDKDSEDKSTKPQDREEELKRTLEGTGNEWGKEEEGVEEDGTLDHLELDEDVYDLAVKLPDGRITTVKDLITSYNEFSRIDEYKQAQTYLQQLNETINSDPLKFYLLGIDTLYQNGLIPPELYAGFAKVIQEVLQSGKWNYQQYLNTIKELNEKEKFLKEKQEFEQRKLQEEAKQRLMKELSILENRIGRQLSTDEIRALGRAMQELQKSIGRQVTVLEAWSIMSATQGNEGMGVRKSRPIPVGRQSAGVGGSGQEDATTLAAELLNTMRRV